MRKNYQQPEVEYVVLSTAQPILADLGNTSNPWAQSILEAELEAQEQAQAQKQAQTQTK